MRYLPEGLIHVFVITDKRDGTVKVYPADRSTENECDRTCRLLSEVLEKHPHKGK